MAAVIQVRSDVPFVDDIVTVLETDDMDGYRLACSAPVARTVNECFGLDGRREWGSMEPAMMAAVDHIKQHETRAGA